MSQNGVKLYVIMMYTLFIQPFKILIIGWKLKTLPIGVVVNHLTFWPFVYILTIQNWNEQFVMFA